MASFLKKAQDKIEATLNQSSNKDDNVRSDNYGSHNSNLANKADPRFDSDLDNRNNPTSHVGGHGQTQAYDQHTTTGGAGGFTSSSTSNTYGSNTNNPGYDNPQSTNAGPHNSNLLNKLDPRADSDRDHRNDPTSRVGGHGNTQHHNEGYGHTGGVGGLGTSGTGHHGLGADSGTVPVHHATTHEGHMQTGHTGGLTSSTGASGYGAGSNTYDNPQSTSAGPHSSNLLNKADPRVDSDRDHRNDPTSRVGGYGTQGENYGHTSGTTGGYSTGTTGNVGGYGADTTTGGYGGTHTGSHVGSHGGAHTGTHTGTHTGSAGGYGSNTAGYGDNYNTPGSGNAAGTAGPHNSNILNKLDPRVDSDLDGSKTYGGNQTHR